MKEASDRTGQDRFPDIYRVFNGVEQYPNLARDGSSSFRGLASGPMTDGLDGMSFM